MITTPSTPSPIALNAVRHGILSSQLLLPSESAEEYGKLLSDLTAEYEPKTPTEEILVQELTNTIWRKRRLLSAERASISSGLEESLSKSLRLVNESSPLTLNLSDTASVRHLLAMDTSTLIQYRKMLVEASNVISDHSDMTDTNLFAYLEDILPDSIKQRLEELAEMDNIMQNTSHGLLSTISNLLHSELKAIDSIEQIRLQAYGSACTNINFDVIARYDSALDRKMLRLLDALLTLQQKRKAKEKATI